MSSILEKSVLLKHVAKLHLFTKSPKPIRYIRPVIQDDLITMEMDQRVIIPDDVSISGKYNEQDSTILHGVHNINPELLIKEQLVDELLRTTEEKIYQIVNHIATNNLVSQYTKWDKFKYDKLFPFLNRIISKINLPTEKEIRVKSTTEHGLVKHILKEANLLNTNGTQCRANFIICNLRMARYIMESTYTTISMETINSNELGRFFVEGSLINMVIIINPYLKWNDKSIIIGAYNEIHNIGVNVVTLDNDKVEFSSFRDHSFMGVEHHISLVTKFKAEFIGDEALPPYRKININIKD